MIIYENEEYRLWDCHTHWSSLIMRLLKPFMHLLSIYDIIDLTFANWNRFKGKENSNLENKMMRFQLVLDYYHIDRAINLPVFKLDRKISYELQKKYPKRVIGFGIVNPKDKKLDQNLEDLLKYGVWGVKLHPHLMKFRYDYHSDGVGRIFEFCQENNIVILSHTGSHSEIKNIIPLLKKYDDLGFILGHSGLQPQIEQAYKCAKECPNAYMDMSGNPYTYKFLEAIRDPDIGIERILFGTDIPTLHPRVEIQKVLALPISVDEKRMIFSNNLENFLKKFLKDKFN